MNPRVEISVFEGSIKLFIHFNFENDEINKNQDLFDALKLLISFSLNKHMGIGQVSDNTRDNKYSFCVFGWDSCGAKEEMDYVELVVKSLEYILKLNLPACAYPNDESREKVINNTTAIKEIVKNIKKDITLGHYLFDSKYVDPFD